MNLYEHQRLNQMLRKGKHLLLRMRHPMSLAMVTWSLRHDKAVSNDGNDQNTF